MNPISPVILGKEENEVKIAEHQEEYNTLPGIYLDNGNVLLTRWVPSEEELKQLNENKSMYLYMYTFGRPVTPLILSTEIVNFPKAESRKGRMLQHPIVYSMKKINEEYLRAMIAEIFDCYDSQITSYWIGFILHFKLTIAENLSIDNFKVHQWKIDFSHLFEQSMGFKFEVIKENLTKEKNENAQ